ncbi:MAG: rhomboid family intramembrane serine protease [Chloroflexota bacterium]
MFPLADDNAGRITTPVVCWLLITVNVLVYLYQASLGAAQIAFINQWGLQPYEIFMFRDMAAILTSMFVHGGVIHLIGNLFYLHVFGDNLEDVMGHVPFLIFYLVCGLSATASQVATDPGSRIPLIGASGAIAGVLGGYIRLFPHASVRAAILFVLIRTVPAWVLLGFWFVTNVLSAFRNLGDTGGGVAFMAHVGGFVAGFLLVGLFVDPAALARQRSVRAAHGERLATARGRRVRA